MMWRHGLQRQPLLGFCVLAFGWSWGCWGLAAALKLQLAWPAQVLMFAGGFGPSIAAVLVVWSGRGRSGLRTWLRDCMQWNVGWGWFALAFFGPLVVVALAAGLHVALGGSMPPSPAWGQIPLAVINLFGVLLLGGPLGEEFGWRGYALPHLQVRMGWRLASWLGIHAAAWQQPWRCTPRSITGPPSCP